MYMLGNLKIMLDDKIITDNISYKGAGLLAYLAISEDRTFSRDKLASLFWGSSSEDAARYNLRYNLWSLRKILEDNEKGYKILDGHKDTCKFNLNNNVYIDVFHMEGILGKLSQDDNDKYIKSLEKAKNIYKGDFLEGFYIKDCSEFNDWIFFERERLQRKYFDTLYRLAKAYKTKGNFIKSIDNIEEMLNINPLQEELYVKLIRIYLKMGDRNNALQQYERCRKILREELNISPMEETKEIYKEIRDYSRPASGYKELKNKKVLDNKDKWVIYNENFTDKDTKTLITNCYPIENLQYYWLSSLIKEIIDNYNIQVLKGFPDYYWQDIYRIESSVGKIVEKIDSQINLTIITEKNKIFSAILKLLHEITKESSLSICINNIQCIDDTSYEFLKLALFKAESLNLQFVITGEESDCKVKEVRKFFKLKSL